MLKKFIVKASAFVFIGLTLFSFAGEFFVSEQRLEKYVFFYKVIKRSKDKFNAQHLVLGDSVAGQLTAPLHLQNGFSVLTTVQGFSLIGQYIMLRNIIQNRPDNLRYLTLIYVPQSFSNNLDIPYTLEHLVKPFFTWENLSHFSPQSLSLLARRPLFFLNLFRFVQANYILNIDYFALNPMPTTPYEPFTKRKAYLSDISIEYLKRISELCKTHKIRFRVLGTPVSQFAATDFEFLRKQIHEQDFGRIFSQYFDYVKILEDSWFTDSVHLTAESLQKLSYHKTYSATF